MGFNIVKLTDPIQFTNVAGGLVPKGAYAGGTTYAVGDSVSYNGSSYVCILSSTGNLPTNTTYWQVLANKGDTGSTGATGPASAWGTIPGTLSDQTDLQNALNAKVNKAGDTMTGNLNMGTYNLIGGTGVTDVLKLQATTGNGTAGSAAIQLLTGDNGATTALTVLNNGNVGIGTTSPDAKLQVQTDTNKDIRLITATHDTLTSLGSGIAFSRQSDGSYNMSGIMSWNNGGLALAGREGIAFATGGGLHYSSTIERMRITDAGNVGIGTTTPGAKLQVDTGASTTIGQIIKGAASQTADLLQIQDSSANKLMVVSSGGNVGIGVAAPATPLEVNGIVRADRTAVPAQYIQLDGGDGNNTALRAVAANKFLYIDNSDTSGTNLYNAIVFRNGTAGDTERMRVDANGNVGIGTASPNYRLEVLLPGSGTGKTISIGSVNGGSYGGLGFDANGMYLTKFDNNAGLYQNGTTGNVGIGTTSPSEKLDVSGTVKATGYKSSDGSAGVSGSFTTTDGKTITIKDGLVVSIV